MEQQRCRNRISFLAFFLKRRNKWDDRGNTIAPNGSAKDRNVRSIIVVGVATNQLG